MVAHERDEDDILEDFWGFWHKDNGLPGAPLLRIKTFRLVEIQVLHGGGYAGICQDCWLFFRGVFGFSDDHPQKVEEERKLSVTTVE